MLLKLNDIAAAGCVVLVFGAGLSFALAMLGVMLFALARLLLTSLKPIARRIVGWRLRMRITELKPSGEWRVYYEPNPTRLQRKRAKILERLA